MQESGVAGPDVEAVCELVVLEALMVVTVADFDSVLIADPLETSVVVADDERVLLPDWLDTPLVLAEVKVLEGPDVVEEPDPLELIGEVWDEESVDEEAEGLDMVVRVGLGPEVAAVEVTEEVDEISAEVVVASKPLWYPQSVPELFSTDSTCL